MLCFGTTSFHLTHTNHYYQFLSHYQPQLDILRREVNGLLSSWKQVRVDDA